MAKFGPTCWSCGRVALIVSLFVAIASSAGVHNLSKRAVSAETLSSSPNNNMDSGDGGASKTCHSRTPCGWAVYTPFTRTVDYFMKNTCVCSKGKACLRTDDDLSVSAYVYRCRVEASPSEADTEPPT